MNLAKLFEMQRKLDEHIEQEHPRQEGEDRLAKKILALQVELGELANELPEVFKFWSNKKNNREKALKEYVDCLHFILSIGVELGMPHRLLLGNVQRNEMLDDDFIALYDEVHTLYHAYKCAYKCQLNKKFVRGYYESVFEHFLALGERLGFTWEQVEEAYMKKNAENHSRQERGY